MRINDAKVDIRSSTLSAFCSLPEFCRDNIRAVVQRGSALDELLAVDWGDRTMMAVGEGNLSNLVHLAMDTIRFEAKG